MAALEQVVDDAWRGLVQVIHESEQMLKGLAVKMERTSGKVDFAHSKANITKEVGKKERGT